ncbi:MAG: YraN family protein [Bacteroidales bacterium]|nr:YraN family protein [Bacteroidales bacterium]
MREAKGSVGKRGEDLACRYLQGLGHEIVARNWRASHLEIDIISLSGSVLHIVEVKTRVVPSQAAPEANVDRRKRECLVKAAQAFIHSSDRLPLGADLEVSFDVVSVLLDGEQAEIEYYPQAFIPIYA